MAALAPFLPWITAATAVASTGVAVAEASRKPPDPAKANLKILAAQQAQDRAQAEAAARLAQRTALRASVSGGYNPTALTGGQGLGAAPTERKTLLGL